MQEPGTASYSRGDVISRKYEIEAHLGDGLFGATYKARHIASGKNLVIKFLWPELNENDGNRAVFEEAFRRAKAVRHPGLVRYGEIAEHNGEWYFTQEFFKSKDLRKILEEHSSDHKNMSLQEACQITIKALESLQAAHESGIHHFDLKPENILVATEHSGPGGSKVVQNIKVTDVGLATTVGSLKTKEEFDERPSFIYQAPELGTMAGGGTSQTDVYSVGVMFYEMLVGKHPSSPLVFPSKLRDDLPEHVDQIVEMAIAPDTQDRYPACTDMVRDVQRTFQEDILHASRPTSFKVIASSIALAVVLVGVASGLALKNKEAIAESETHRLETMTSSARAEVLKSNQIPSDEEYNRINSQEPDMVFVPGGEYLQGRMHSEDAASASSAESLSKKVFVDDFFIDRYEFPNIQDKVPVGKVAWARAKETCESFGKRLCSSDEWEKACKGPKNTIYSFGDTWDPSICTAGKDYKLGGMADCRSAYFVFDMSGGLTEWTSTPRASSKNRYVVKGGSKSNPEVGYRCAFSNDQRGNYGASDSSLSFRCCKDVE